jgi:hypothetical protein
MTDIFSQIYGRKNPYYEQVLKEGTNTSPIRHWSQGASRLAFALLAGLERNDQAKRDREGMATWMQKQGQPFQPTRQAPPMPGPALSQQQPMPNAAPPTSPPMSPPMSPPASPPMFPPAQLPLMTGPSGEPVPSRFLGENVNLFDPRPWNPGRGF